MKYSLGPYVWRNNAWEFPAGAIAAIDLRNQSQQATPSVADGVGLFTSNVDLGGSYVLLGDGDCCTMRATPAMKSAWNSQVGYMPSGNKLADLIYDQLTTGSDPTGVSAVKTLMPDSGALRVFLGPQIKGTQFRLNYSREANNVITTMQEDYRKNREDVLAGRLPIDQHRRVLGWWAREYGINNPEDVFIPNGLPKETSVPPSTVLSDDFNKADSPNVGNQLTWNETEVEAVWANFGNAAILDSGPATLLYNEMTIIPTSAYSSANHNSSAIITSVPTSQWYGVNVRVDNITKLTYYFARVIEGVEFYRVYKLVAGVATLLNSLGETITDPVPMNLEIIGSTIKLFSSSVLKVETTDTSITGNLYSGLFARNNGAGDVAFDSWTGQDITQFEDGSGGSVGGGAAAGLVAKGILL